jgi:hypothetical protein
MAHAPVFPVMHPGEAGILRGFTHVIAGKRTFILTVGKVVLEF